MSYAQCLDDLDRWREALRRERGGSEVIREIEARINRETDPFLTQALHRLLADDHDSQGNPDAADAARRANPEQEIFRWRDECREQRPGDDLVPALEERIHRERHPFKLHALRDILAREHRTRGNYGAAAAAWLADFAADPARSQPMICLARQQLDDELQPDAAMRTIDRALAAASRSGFFRREALGVKARIALKLRSYAVVEDILQKIMQLTFTRGNLDVGVERDFLDRAPPGRLDPGVARAYNTYCRAHGKARTAADQDIDDLILRLARARWQKMARIIAKALNEFEASQVYADGHAIAGRVRVLADEGALMVQGNMSCWRRCEIRLLS